MTGNEGYYMMWYDGDKKTSLAAKLIGAVRYYTDKYGLVPNAILVHPSAVEATGGKIPEIGNISVRPWRAVLPGHLWVGQVDDGNDG